MLGELEWVLRERCSASRTIGIKEVFPRFTCGVRLAVSGLSVASPHQPLEPGQGLRE